SYIWSLAFSPGGETLISGSGDSTVRLWDTAPLKDRYQERREAAALRPEADRLVARLFAEKADAAAVAAALGADRSLSEPRKNAASRAWYGLPGRGGGGGRGGWRNGARNGCPPGRYAGHAQPPVRSTKPRSDPLWGWFASWPVTWVNTAHPASCSGRCPAQ